MAAQAFSAPLVHLRRLHTPSASSRLNVDGSTHDASAVDRVPYLYDTPSPIAQEVS